MYQSSAVIFTYAEYVSSAHRHGLIGQILESYTKSIALKSKRKYNIIYYMTYGCDMKTRPLSIIIYYILLVKRNYMQAIPTLHIVFVFGRWIYIYDQGEKKWIVLLLEKENIPNLYYRMNCIKRFFDSWTQLEPKYWGCWNCWK
jgi:hypothetical protein